MRPDIPPPEWVQDAVFYSIFPDRFKNGDLANVPPDTRPWDALPDRDSFFGGDLKGIIEGLDYLQELGVNAIYLTPIFAAPSNHKYDVADYFEVDPHFGGSRALAALVEAIHRRGMKLILDGVFNHCGERHPFFQDLLRRGRTSPFWDWFVIHGDEVIREPHPNYACWAGVRSLPEWNHRNRAVREYLFSIARHWIHTQGIDGWRLDAVEHMPPDFVKELRTAVKRERPDAYILGEVMGFAAAWLKYGALDGVMNYRLWEGLLHFIAWESWDATRFLRLLEALWGDYPRENLFASYNPTGSHDKPRLMTLCRGDRRKVALIVACIFALPGAPAIYYGDEIGLEGGEDPDCRRPFPWDPARWDGELRVLFRTLVGIRKKETALRRGELRFVAATDRAFSFVREWAEERVVFCGNAGDRPTVFPLDRSARDLLTGELHRSKVVVPAKSFVFLKPR